MVTKEVEVESSISVATTEIVKIWADKELKSLNDNTESKKSESKSRFRERNGVQLYIFITIVHRYYCARL